MTTLPQNPAMRMSRPPGAVNTANSNTGGTIASGMTGADVIRVLRGNILWIILLLIVSAGVGLMVNRYLSNNYSKYTARGLLQVEMSQNASRITPVVLNDTAVVVEQRTHVNALKQDALFQSVLQNPDSPIRQTSWYRSLNMSPRDARADLEKNFSVNPILETRLISVGMTFSSPADTRVIVESIVGAYLTEQQKRINDQAYDLTIQLQTRRQAIDSELRDVRNQLAVKKDDLTRAGINSGSMNGIRVNPLDIEVENATKTLIGVNADLAQGQAALAQLRESASNPDQVSPMVQRMLDNDAEYTELQRLVRNTQFGYEEAKRNGPDGPAAKNYKGRLDALQVKEQSTRREMIAKFRQVVEGSTNQQVAMLTAAAKDAQAKVDSLRLQQLQIQKTVSDFLELDNRERNLSRQQNDNQASLDSVQSGSSQGTKVTWMAHPIEPDVPSFPKLTVTLSVAMTLGLTLGLLIAFVRELLDQTIRSPRDVMKVGSIPLLGTIPHEDDDPQAAGARLPLVIAEAPQSMTAENLRQMRTRLQTQGNLDTTRSLLITSPNPGEGKTVTAANLAAGLALVGRRILLVDANFKRPELHKLFGVEGKDGFSNALTSPENLATLAKSTKVPNLSVLPAGPKPTNATEMLESSLLTDFIDKALESYDHVIFDSGAILFASETVAMAPRVDGVITVVRARSSTRGVLARVKDNLRQIKANSLGVVINGIRAYGGGYYNRNMKTYYAYSNNE